jgi:hypothetical protein
MPVMRLAALLALLLFAAGSAYAHGGKPHAPAHEAQPNQAVHGKPAGTAAFAAPCEEQPGHACACGNLSLCSNGGKQAVVMPAPAHLRLDRFQAQPLVRTASGFSAAPPPRSLARAPPSLS